MRRFLAILWSTTKGCGRLPLLAALALMGSTLVVPWVVPATEPLVVEGPRGSFQVIEGVLAKRAPELGLTLRHQLALAIAEESERAGYDPLMIVAIMDVESDFQEEAVSNRGARGLMQIKPSTLHFLAEKQGLKLTREEVAADPALCVRLGVRYLRELHDRFGDLDRALMAYNAGPGRIRAAIKEQELEAFRRYPNLVRREYLRLREGEGLGGDWALAQVRVEPPKQ